MPAVFRRLGRPILAALLIGAAVPASAQLTPYGRESPSAALGRHLRSVAASPRNLDALRGAGRAALELGDLDAAVGFFARAEEVAPRDGRTKAGLGSAFTMLQQPGAALRYFADAASLGVPAIDIAADRGLAHDLRGHWRAAQRDYRLVLAARPDPEVTRRLAVSQAAGGDTKAALATLDPQLRAKDPAAWRSRAFILAMGGDAAGAQRAVAAVLPPATANGFSPYFRQMASLSAAQKVAAAQFGSMPGSARTIRMADLMSEGERAARVALESVRTSPSPPTVATSPVRTAGPGLDAGRPDQAQAALGRGGDGVPLPTSRSDGPVAGTLVPTRVAVAPPVSPSAAPTETATNSTGTTVPSGGTAIAGPLADVPPVAAPPSGSLATVATPPASNPLQGPPVPVDLAPAPAVTTVAAEPVTSGPEPSETLASAAPPPSQPKVEALAAAAPPPPRPKVERPVARTVAALRTAEPASSPRATEAPRHYVQLGIGQDPMALQADWRRLRTRHAALLAGQDAWTAPANRTNRLLVGPFPSAAAAQAFVNKLAAGDLSATRYASEAGQAVNALR